MMSGRITLILVLAFAGVALFQQRKAAALLRQEAESLQVRVARLQPLQKELTKSDALDGTGAVANPNRTIESLQVQMEVPQRQSTVRDAPTSTTDSSTPLQQNLSFASAIWQRNEWGNLGQATPADVVISLLWAASNHEVTHLRELLAFLETPGTDPDDIAGRVAIDAARFSAVRLASFAPPTNGDPHGMIRIQLQSSEELELEPERWAKQLNLFVAFESNRWKILVPPAAAARYREAANHKKSD